jgi:hypothetical protein
MAAWSNFAENKILDWFFRGQALGITGGSAAAGTGPTSLYFALFTTAPDVETGSGGVEVSGNAYARYTLASSLTNWNGTNGTTAVSSGTSGIINNAVAIGNFPTPTPSGWGTVVAVGVYDAVTGGNLICSANLSSPKLINSGDTVTFPAASLTFNIDL